jgi:hypothetical protein
MTTASPEEFAAFDEAQYRDIAMDRLVMIAVGRLHGAGLDLSFENAVVAAYRLFPRKFTLIGFPTYPDSKRVHDQLFHCFYKSKRWLSGKTRVGFSITDLGDVIIRDAELLLTGQQSGRKPARSQARRWETLLAELMDSAAFTKYVEGGVAAVTWAEFCHALQGTLDTPTDILVANLAALKRMAAEQGEMQTVAFLEAAAKQFAASLSLKS